MEKFEEIIEEIYKHLECNNQNWLFGAGISYASKLPIMAPLTKRVKTLLAEGRNGELNKLYKDIESDLADDHHIEHVLSHIGDLIALSERSKEGKAHYIGNVYPKNILSELHKVLVGYIADIMRYGYVEPQNSNPEEVGSIDTPIVSIELHRNFVKAFLSLKANLISRSSIAFFTTNYDTLLEDALVLEKQKICDGFTGTAIGFWNPELSFNDTNSFSVSKLHGSVDWYNNGGDGIIRCRYGVNYLNNAKNVLIYPQATKYVETQKNPFSFLFSQFRSRLNSINDNILVTSGYSFGDNHINNEIEFAINRPDNQTTLIIFIKDVSSSRLVLSWLKDKDMSKKIFVATENGLYHRSDEIIRKENNDEAKFEWWTFNGLIDFLRGGNV